MPARRGPGPAATWWYFREDGEPLFDPVVFDERALAARGALLGSARAGRGNTCFLVLDGHELVLRHYRRGGLARRLSERRYLWTGLARTRAVREFELLCELEARALPAPVPYACAITRHGPTWSGSLVTRRLPGRTLSEHLAEAGAAGLDTSMWQAVGHCIARFHAAGCRHADLNAHNVLIDDETVYLLDLDRARWHRTVTGIARWQRANLVRLRRSLKKVAAAERREFDVSGFTVLEQSWRTALLG